MKLPPPSLIILRLVATIELSLVIGQAGWAAAFLGGERHYRATHATWALVTLVACMAGALVYLALRRSAGVVNIVLALLVAAAVTVQYLLGEFHVVAVHIFLGVLIAITTTALTSWTYRHELPSRTKTPPAT